MRSSPRSSSVRAAEVWPLTGIAIALPVDYEPACAVPDDRLGAAARTRDGAFFAVWLPDAGEQVRLAAPVARLELQSVQGGKPVLGGDRLPQHDLVQAGPP